MAQEMDVQGRILQQNKNNGGKGGVSRSGKSPLEKNRAMQALKE